VSDAAFAQADRRLRYVVRWLTLAFFVVFVGRVALTAPVDSQVVAMVFGGVTAWLLARQT
jgi:hypothetical protein